MENNGDPVVIETMNFRVRLLRPGDPVDQFPDPADARATLGYPDGLLAIGGDLSAERLLYAYRHGIFPWYNEDQPIMWWSPDPRAVIFPDEFHMSRSLARNLRRKNWSYSLNQAFTAVIHGCASGRGEHGTWITTDMMSAYESLHKLGYAHSVETWLDGKLVGGIYGLRLGQAFFGESMFSIAPDASKIAISALVQLCRDEHLSMIDCQLESPHLKSLGMRAIAREEFLSLLGNSIEPAKDLPDWQFKPRPASPLAQLRSV